jgi:hypothetical protein
MLAALLGQATGCSILFVKGPPPEDERGRIVHCTESNVAPLIDMMIASYQTVRIAFALSASDADYRNSQLSRSDDVAIGASLLALFAASSIIGFHQTSACRDALLEAEYPSPPPRARPRASRPPPPRKLNPPTPAQQKLDEEEEERAVRARAADMARASRAADGPDGGAPPDDEPAVVPARPAPPATPQRADPE